LRASLALLSDPVHPEIARVRRRSVPQIVRTSSRL
jgi:hypothetical protein